jgi:hypothetical protein
MPEKLQGDRGEEAKFLRLSVLVFVVAVATIVAMTYVQNVRVPGFVESAVRTSANLGGLIAVPVLLILGFGNWYKMSRAKLPTWRNGLALSSMILPSLVWATSHFPHIDPFDLFATLLCSNLLAGLLAIALTGKARLLVLSAVLLLWAGLESGIYS